MNIKEVKLINEANYKRSKTGQKRKEGRPGMLLRQVVVERPTKIPVFSDPHSRSFSTVVENQEKVLFCYFYERSELILCL